MAAPPSSASTCSGERWLPLESSPDVFNQFMWSLGVPQGEAEFHDVYGLEADALAMMPQPVLAVIFCFPDPPEKSGLDLFFKSTTSMDPYERARVFEKDDEMTRAHSLASSDEMNPSNTPKQLIAEEKETRDEVYFMKQIESLGNACGTIALLHAVGNARSEISLLENSGLDLFFKSTTSMDPYKRARVFEKDDVMARAHSLASSAGDTELSDVVEEHYVCFMALNGTLYELDGMKDGPIKQGSTSPESLLQDAVHIIKSIMHKIPDSMNFNVMVLSRKPK